MSVNVSFFVRRAVGRALGIACLVACPTLSSEAAAQGATPLERYQPVPAGDALFASPSAGVDAYSAFDGAAVLSYANSPLSLRRQTSTGQFEDAGAIVSHQVVLHAMASFSLFSRLKLELDVPLTLNQEGDFSSVSTQNQGVSSPSGFAMNDLRLGARVSLLQNDGWIPGVAAAFSAWLPTGNVEAFTSNGSARFEPRLIVGADHKNFVYSASLGRVFGDANVGLLGSEVTFTAGVAARIDRFQIGPELFGSVVLDRSETTANSGVPISSRAGGGLEALLAGKVHLGPLTLGIGGGLGFLRGVGTPDFRLMTSVAIRPFERKEGPKTDPNDGSANGSRNGANTAGSANAGGVQGQNTGENALLDTDGDTVIDTEDACPRVVGDASPTAKKRGCPPDRDGDSISDAEDKCPDEPGVYAAGEKNGCPPDTDGDGIADPQDACPNEAGPKTSDPKTNGCPEAVRVEGTQIVILQQVNFETAKARILPVSFSLLQQVADVLRQHPEIARIAVDGHTDNRGIESSNMDLSRARAVSVMRWLTEKGVDARRLEARGFGPKRPISDNKTDAGRAKNRRVEFQIRKRTDKGEAGWFDGPID